MSPSGIIELKNTKGIQPYKFDKVVIKNKTYFRFKVLVKHSEFIEFFAVATKRIKNETQ